MTKLRIKVERLQRRADALKGKPGYHAMLERLRTARTSLLAAENALKNRTGQRG